jgi:hypothetical protein
VYLVLVDHLIWRTHLQSDDDVRDFYKVLYLVSAFTGAVAVRTRSVKSDSLFSCGGAQLRKRLTSKTRSVDESLLVVGNVLALRLPGAVFLGAPDRALVVIQSIARTVVWQRWHNRGRMTHFQLNNRCA